MEFKQESVTPAQSGIPLLRFEFVGMLFALAVAEVAVKWAELVALKPGPFYQAMPAHFHLALAICIISTSWLGWSWSNAAGNIRNIEHPFSIEFIILLVDVGLVILYFMVARSVELVGPNYPVPSAREELYLVTTIFGIYFLWDFLTKALFPSIDERKRFWPRGYVSLSCFAICLVGALSVSRVKSAAAVCLADTGLVALIFLFRAWKRSFKAASGVSALVVAVAFTLAYILG